MFPATKTISSELRRNIRKWVYDNMYEWIVYGKNSWSVRIKEALVGFCFDRKFCSAERERFIKENHVTDRVREYMYMYKENSDCNCFFFTFWQKVVELHTHPPICGPLSRQIKIGKVTSLWPLMSVGGLVIIFKMGGKLHFNAPIGALVTIYPTQVCVTLSN